MIRRVDLPSRDRGLTHHKLEVSEMAHHSAARAVTGYLVIRRGVHQVADTRAIEPLTGADLMRFLPTPRTRRRGECCHSQAAGRLDDDRGGRVGDVLDGGGERRRGIQVYGCSPGCLVLSLAASVLLTVLVNILIRAL